jgi:hypothetical protein
MYRIVQLDRQWIVCVGAAMLLAFDHKEDAIRTAADAETLLKAMQPPRSSPLMTLFVQPAEASHDSPDAGLSTRSTTAFVERRRTDRTAVQRAVASAAG